MRVPKFLKSPIQIDYIYDSWTGGIGKQFKQLYDFSAEKLGFVDRPPRPFSSNWIKNIDKLPVISGVAFVKESYFDTGLIVAHEGMVVNNKNIIHASSEYGKTVNMDFMEYYFRSDGPLFDGVLFYSFHPIIK